MTDKTKTVLHNLAALVSATVLLLPDYLEVAPAAVSQLERDLDLLPRIPLIVKIGHVLGVLMLAAVVGSRIVLYGRVLRKLSSKTDPPAGAGPAASPTDLELAKLIQAQGQAPAIEKLFQSQIATFNESLREMSKHTIRPDSELAKSIQTQTSTGSDTSSTPSSTIRDPELATLTQKSP